jgi:hypothetical protein
MNPCIKITKGVFVGRTGIIQRIYTERDGSIWDDVFFAVLLDALDSLESEVSRHIVFSPDEFEFVLSVEAIEQIREDAVIDERDREDYAKMLDGR